MDDNYDFFCDNGYVILKNVFSNDEIDYINNYINDLWINKDKKVVIDEYIGTDKERRTYIQNCSNDVKNQPYKLNDLYIYDKKIRDIISKDEISCLLKKILNDKPTIINNLNLEYGSQQDLHTDSLFMTPPKNDDGLAAIWIALEDVDSDSGPLGYYPGSHKITQFKFSNGSMHKKDDEFSSYCKYMNEKVTELNLEKKTFLPKKGDVLIWHAFLYHCGTPINNPSLTRKSMVIHYFREKDWSSTEDITPNMSYFKKNPPFVPTTEIKLLKNENYTYDNLIKIGFDRKELIEAGFTPTN